MINQPSIEDTFAGHADPVATVADGSARGELVAVAGQVAQLGGCSTDYDRLSDADA